MIERKWGPSRGRIIASVSMKIFKSDNTNVLPFGGGRLAHLQKSHVGNCRVHSDFPVLFFLLHFETRALSWRMTHSSVSSRGLRL